MDEDYKEREQSWLKHFALRTYLEAASRIIGSWKDFSYVDCCAGPWESRSPSYDDTSFGIAVKVLEESMQSLRDRGKQPRFRALLIEEAPAPYAKLAAFARLARKDRIVVEARNWDFREHAPDIIQFVSNPPSFPFIFVDPTGWTPAQIGALGPLLRIKPGEFLINFMSSFIVRFLNDERTNLEDILGADYRDLRNLSHEEQEEEAVKRYCEQIRRQGNFDYVCALPVMRRDQDAIHFFLIYATRNAEGVRVFKEVEKRTEKETEVVRAERQQKERLNLDLFSADVLYKREERYRRIAGRNHRNAREALDSLISERDHVLYDDCWAEALQFPTVYEPDLRGWLDNLEHSKLIRVNGRKRPNEVLKRGHSHIIVKI
jgi:three-Cys-motif partner protein